MTISDEHAQRIAELCGGVPLALRIAGKLIQQSVLNADELIRRLQESLIQTLNDDQLDVTPRVETTLELSYSLLKPRARKQFAYISVLPESFHATVASAVLKDTQVRTQKSLKFLTSRCLLEYSGRDKLYRMHPLLQAFGMTKIEFETRLRIEHTIDLHYASNLMAISDYCFKHAMQDFEKERDGYARFIQGLGRNSSESRDRQYYCLKIATGIWPILGDKAVPCGQWMRLHESCLKAFEAEPRSYLVRHYVQTAIQLSTMYLFNKSDQQSALNIVRRVEPIVLEDPPPFRVTLEYYSHLVALCRIAEQGDGHDDCTSDSIKHSISFFEPALRNITAQLYFQRLNSSEFLSTLEIETIKLRDHQPALSKFYDNLPFEFYLNSVRERKRSKESVTLRQGLWQQADGNFSTLAFVNAQQCLEKAIESMRRENASDWQIADALFHAGYWMTVWKRTDDAYRYLNESLTLTGSIRKLHVGNRHDTQTSRAGCDTQLCMGDALLASGKSTHHSTIFKMLSEANVTYCTCSCPHSLQSMHLSWQVYAFGQQLAGSKKEYNSAMALISRHPQFSLARVRKWVSQLHSELRRYGRQLYAIRSLDCFYLIRTYPIRTSQLYKKLKFANHPPSSIYCANQTEVNT